MSLLRLRQTRENSFSPACVPHPAPTVYSTMSSACPLLYCSYSRVAPWESLLLPMRQALPVRVWKPRVGLPLSIDVLLRPRGRKLRTLHRCHTLPAAAWRRRTDLHLLMPVVWKLCQLHRRRHLAQMQSQTGNPAFRRMVLESTSSPREHLESTSSPPFPDS